MLPREQLKIFIIHAELINKCRTND